nr:hypothetical protein Iba_chr04eCG0810 [Ipomoea batatas]
MHSMCLSTTGNTISKYCPCKPFHCSLDYWSSSYFINLLSTCVLSKHSIKCISNGRIILISNNFITIWVPGILIPSLIFPLPHRTKPNRHRYTLPRSGSIHWLRKQLICRRIVDWSTTSIAFRICRTAPISARRHGSGAVPIS